MVDQFGYSYDKRFYLKQIGKRFLYKTEEFFE